MKNSIKLLLVLCVIQLFGNNLLISQNEDKELDLIKVVVSLTGCVMSADTREPVSITLIVLDESNKKVNSVRSNAYEKGAYFLTGLKPGKKYYISINQPEYFKEKYEILVPYTDKYLEISRDFLVKPLRKGIRFPLTIAPFELNKSKLRFGAAEILDEWYNILSYNPNVRIEIECYPDDNNNPEANFKLTEGRCNSILNYLVAKGFDDSFISIRANREVDPLNPPPTKKQAKGKKYIGTTYIRVVDF